MSTIVPTRIEHGPAMLLAGLRRHHTFTDAARTIVAQWSDFVQLGRVPGQRDGVTYGAMCGTDHERQTFEYMTAVEVDAFDALPPGMGRMRVPAHRYAVFTHSGHVSTLRDTWGAIWSEWLPRSGLTPADTPDFERYDERFDPRTGSGIVEIWFPIEERS